MSITSDKQASSADARILSELKIRVRRDDILIGLVVLNNDELGLVGHALQIPIEVRCDIGFAQCQLIFSEIFETFLFSGTIGEERRVQDDETRMRPTLLGAI